MNKHLLLLILFVSIKLNAQMQKGTDIDGEARGDVSGYSVSMPDANTIAIGAPGNSDIADSAGHVRVYTWNGSAWMQKGTDIDGEAMDDLSGVAVCMPDANNLAVGAPFNDGIAGDFSGHIRIYSWNGSDWIQKGNDIDGQQAFVTSGISVSMPDSNTVATVEHRSDTFSVFVYTWNGTDWIMKGKAILGLNLNYSLQYSNYIWNRVHMPDVNTVAFSGYIDYTGSTSAGSACIFAWNGTNWVKKGQTINGEATRDNFGHSLYMPDANTIAIGAPGNDGNGTDAGHVRVYKWNGWAWFLKGSDIEGEAAGDLSGFSLCMPDTNTIAIGAIGNDGNGTGAGHVRVFSWNGSDWVKNGYTFEGESSFDSAGIVSMPDANTIAIGAPFNDGNGTDAGHVRVYNLSNANSIENSFGYDINAYPIPTRDNVNIELKAKYQNLFIVVRNIEGKEVLRKSFSNTNNFQINIPGEKGIYLIEISAENKKTILNIIKE